MAQTPPTYRVLSKTPLGGTGFWDYVTVDPDACRVYITHNNQIEVVDADTKKLVGVISNTAGAHGVAIATRQNRGFITNGRSNTVTMFDPKTLKTLGDVPAGINPDALLYDAFSGRVFSFNNDSRDITVLEAATGNVLATFSIGGNPEAGATDGKGGPFSNCSVRTAWSAGCQFDSDSSMTLGQDSLFPMKQTNDNYFVPALGAVLYFAGWRSCSYRRVIPGIGSLPNKIGLNRQT